MSIFLSVEIDQIANRQFMPIDMDFSIDDFIVKIRLFPNEWRHFPNFRWFLIFLSILRNGRCFSIQLFMLFHHSAQTRSGGGQDQSWKSDQASGLRSDSDMDSDRSWMSSRHSTHIWLAEQETTRNSVILAMDFGKWGWGGPVSKDSILAI